ncbi:hypothetical protein FGO68_gene12949 [Halteria grandinella]|uniref:Uncharacterized protein n=1 Tax=Halteria grandinella TaxID=5974 RepID=A0A8J8SVG3_HALGN|nr:hypothetical protein FGO68_gene12949 [Halteria grandinella]
MKEEFCKNQSALVNVTLKSRAISVLDQQLQWNKVNLQQASPSVTFFPSLKTPPSCSSPRYAWQSATSAKRALPYPILVLRTSWSMEGR